MASLFTIIQRYGMRRVRTFFPVLCICLIIVLIKFSTNKNHSNSGKQSGDSQESPAVFDKLYQFHTHLDGKKLIPIPADLIREDKCPACYGSDLCEKIATKEIQIYMPDRVTPESSKGVFYGKYHDNLVVIKSLGSDDRKRKFDSYVCKMVTTLEDCDVGKAILDSQSFLHNSDILSPEALHKLHQATSLRHHLFTACVSEEIIRLMSASFSSSKDGQLSISDTANFIYTLVLNPELAILKFVEDLPTTFPLPAQYGRCGRLAIEEAVGMTMDKVLQMNWNFRAEVALKLLDMIDLFKAEGEKWQMVLTKALFDNFALFPDGHLVLVDVEDIVIIPKAQDAPMTASVCNAPCIETFQFNVLDTHHHLSQDKCQELSARSTDFMYYHICQLLSDQKEHKKTYLDKTSKEYNTGFLHDPPKDIASELSKLISECIEETKPLGRIEAVEKLSERLRNEAYDDLDSDELEQKNNIL